MSEEKLKKKQCTQCAAPLPKSGWTCEYCGTSFEAPYTTPPFNFGRVVPTSDYSSITTTSVYLTMSGW